MIDATHKLPAIHFLDVAAFIHHRHDERAVEVLVATHTVDAEFLLATSVFRDPLALPIYDDEHSETEERWVTIGRAVNGQTLVVVHTAQHTSPGDVTIRIISARRADRDERRNYEEAPH